MCTLTSKSQHILIKEVDMNFKVKCNSYVKFLENLYYYLCTVKMKKNSGKTGK